MTNVVLFSEQPILAAGLEAVIGSLEDVRLSAVLTDLDILMEHVRTSGPCVVLLEVTAAVTLTTLSNLKSTAGSSPVVLWINTASTEFVSQALALGVRGILRKSLPIELQIKCLRSAAAGDLWVEQGLCDRLLTSKQISLTRRERQLVSLLAQGLKNKELAYAMSLSEGTVKVYLSRLFQKVGANDRFELALFALKNLYFDVAEGPEPARSAGDSHSPALPSPAFFPANFVSLVNVPGSTTVVH
jgi:DNA-binding NarL/FixJ family response regulator